MSKIKEENSLNRYPLVVEAIDFNMYSVVYAVGFEDKTAAKRFREGDVLFFEVHKDISTKDLILKTNTISLSDMRVVFTPCNVTPHFYQGILNKTLHNVEEYESELDAIFTEQDVIGYAILL